MAVTRKKPAKDQAILSAAQGEFLKHGYRHTSIETIAKAAGMAKGTLYLYFTSKEEVFRAVSQQFITWFLGQAREAAKGDGTVSERVAAVLQAKFGTIHALASRSPHGRELIDSSQGVVGDLYREADEVYVKVLASVLREEKLSLPALEAAWLLFRAAQGVEFNQGTAVSTEEMTKRLTQLATVIVRGAAARG